MCGAWRTCDYDGLLTLFMRSESREAGLMSAWSVETPVLLFWRPNSIPVTLDTIQALNLTPGKPDIRSRQNT